MKIILHIGQSKTGTSAIQAFLMLNRERLKSHGVLYPSVRVGGITVDLSNHNSVADALMGHSRYPNLSADQYFEQFFSNAERSQANCMILSAEHFIGGEPRVWAVSSEQEYFDLYHSKIEKLSSYLNGHDISILVYLRPQVNWLSSAISQTIRIERLMSEKQIYQNDHQFFETFKPMLRYHDILKLWDDTLTPNDVIALPYHRNYLINQNSIADFLYHTKLDHIDFPDVLSNLQVNTSISREFLEVKKTLNSEPKTKNQERVTINCLERLSRNSRFSSSYHLSSDLIEEIESYVYQQNKNLNVQYIKDGYELTAYQPENKSINAISQQDIETAMRVFRKEYHKPHSYFLAFKYQLLASLRNHAKPVHSMLHQFKRLQQKILYR